jgi:hypothetical protein
VYWCKAYIPRFTWRGGDSGEEATVAKAAMHVHCGMELIVEEMVVAATWEARAAEG